MIQRKQTLYLLLAAILGVVTLSMSVATVTADGLLTAQVYNLLWLDAHREAHYGVWPLFAMLLAASSVCLYAIFLFKRRIVQARLCLASMCLCLAWYIGVLVVSKSLAPDAHDFQLSFVGAFPAVMAILCFMARKAIMADERLVRAADRIR